MLDYKVIIIKHYVAGLSGREIAKVSSDYHIRFDNAYYSVGREYLHNPIFGACRYTQRFSQIGFAAVGGAKNADIESGSNEVQRGQHLSNPTRQISPIGGINTAGNLLGASQKMSILEPICELRGSPGLVLRLHKLGNSRQGI